MAGFTIRCNGDKVYQEQLRQLSTQLDTPVAQLVREALDLVYGKELSALYKTAFIVVTGGHSTNQTQRKGTRKGRKS